MIIDKERLWGEREWRIDIQDAISRVELEINYRSSNAVPSLNANTYRSAVFWLLIAKQPLGTKFESLAALLDHLESSLARILQIIGASAFNDLCGLGSFRHLYSRHVALCRAAKRGQLSDADGSGGAPPLTAGPTARDLKRDPKFWAALTALQDSWRPDDVKQSAPVAPNLINSTGHDTLPAPNLTAATLHDDDDSDDYDLPQI